MPSPLTCVIMYSMYLLLSGLQYDTVSSVSYNNAPSLQSSFYKNSSSIVTIVWIYYWSKHAYTYTFWKYIKRFKWAAICYPIAVFFLQFKYYIPAFFLIIFLVWYQNLLWTRHEAQIILVHSENHERESSL